MEITVATQNAKKLAEIRQKLPEFDIKPLSVRDFPHELREDGDSLESNAIQKARQVYAVLGTACFADDTGLEVNVLNGAPGVYSARYAGEIRSSEDNMDKLLADLQDKQDRSAQFRTVIALIWKGEEYLFEGICKGKIAMKRMGSEGFGYDPIFIPEGGKNSFAQMSMDEKNAMSHRGRAVEALVHFLRQQKI